VSARVFVHPRCFEGPANGALVSTLQERGRDMSQIFIGPPSPKGHCELVKVVGSRDKWSIMERMDGVQFLHQNLRETPTAAA